jgi:hypothetical protein
MYKLGEGDVCGGGETIWNKNLAVDPRLKNRRQASADDPGVDGRFRDDRWGKVVLFYWLGQAQEQQVQQGQPLEALMQLQPTQTALRLLCCCGTA